MSLIRRTRGTPEPNDFDRFLNVIKARLPWSAPSVWQGTPP